MRYQIIPLLCILFALPADAQPPVPEFTWGNALDYSTKVTQGESGAIYVAGFTILNDLPTTGGGSWISPGRYFLARVDENSVIDWCYYFGSANSTPGWPFLTYSIITDISYNDGHVFVCGLTQSPGMATSGTHLDTFSPVGMDDHAGFIQSYDATDGSLEWGSYYRNNGEGIYPQALAAGASASVYLAYNAFGGDDSHTTLNAAFGDYDGVLMKFDDSGTREWARHYGTEEADFLYDLVFDAPNDLIHATGETAGDDIEGTSTTVSYGARDAFIASFQTDGDVDQARYFGGAQNDAGMAIALDGDVILAGGFTESAELPDGSTCMLNANEHMNLSAGWLAKFDRSNLECLWSYTYGEFDVPSHVGSDADHNFYCLSDTYTDGLATPNAEDDDLDSPNSLLLSVFDPMGALTYRSYVEGDGSTSPSLAIDVDGVVHLTGGVFDATYITSMADPFPGHATEGYRLIRFDPTFSLDCENVEGGDAHPGTACTTMSIAEGVYNDACECVEAVCLELTIQTDDNPHETSWAISGAGLTLTGGGVVYCAEVQETIVEEILLPASGCYSFSVFDAGGNGMSDGADGGYSLALCTGEMLIDNTNDGEFTNESSGFCTDDFCLPVGDVEIITADCGIGDYYLPRGFSPCSNGGSRLIAATTTAVITSALPSTDDGYRFNFFDPDGNTLTNMLSLCIPETIAYCRNLNHFNNSSDVAGGASMTTPANERYRFVNPATWNSRLPPLNVWLNLRVRPIINDVHGDYGPVCTIRFVATQRPGHLAEVEEDAHGLTFEVERLLVSAERANAQQLTLFVNGFDTPMGTAQLEVVDAQGRLLLREQFNAVPDEQWSATVDTPTLLPGLYMVTLRSETDALTQRVMVE